MNFKMDAKDFQLLIHYINTNAPNSSIFLTLNSETKLECRVDTLKDDRATIVLYGEDTHLFPELILIKKLTK